MGHWAFAAKHLARGLGPGATVGLQGEELEDEQNVRLLVEETNWNLLAPTSSFVAAFNHDDLQRSSHDFTLVF